MSAETLITATAPTEMANTIYVSDKAREKVIQLLADAGVANDPSYFLRVGVVGGGCSVLATN